MIADYRAMNRIAAIDILITAGVIAATLSSAMASFLGAPRILQSLSGDRIFPFLLPFAKGYGPSDNPRRGVLLSAAIALATICLGKLNIIAPVVSMFFLISYGLLNYATYFEAKGDSPSFRPRFKLYNYRVSLAGAFACIGAMLAINLAAGFIAAAVLFAIYQYLKRTAGPSRWADSRRSNLLQRVRKNLLAAANEIEHPRDWRPQLLLFSGNPERRKQLLQFAGWIQGRSGFTTVVQIIEGKGPGMPKLKQQTIDELRRDINENELEAFPLAISSTNIDQALHTLVQANGIGPLKANTVLLNWIDQDIHQNTEFLNMLHGKNLRAAFRFGCNIAVLNARHEEWVKLEAQSLEERRIDVWWWNDATSRLMLLLAYLVARREPCHEARIRVLAAGFDKESGETVDDLKKYLDEIRIEAEPEIVACVDADTVAAYSSDATIVFFPFRFRNNLLLDPFGGRVDGILKKLPITVLAIAAEDIDLDAEPEKGKAGEIAAALDTLSDAEERVKKAEKIAARAAKEAESAEKKLNETQETVVPGTEDENLNEIKADVEKTKSRADKAARRSAKTRARAETAAKEAEDIGAKKSSDK